ncbi:MAG: hypothetical protein E6Q44_02880 [Flavobacteriales bacterium]|nr:MAG: hypothetical protein E6Q44_02880 [Flavobacteriales bacterium]
MVRRFLIQCLKLSLPMLALFALVAWVDPYCLYHTGGPIARDLKEKNLYHSGRTMPFSNMLWKLVDFRRHPARNILLGDSRLSYFDLDSLRSLTGDTYQNLGVPGGNYVTIDHTFRYADSLANLQNVVVQVSFRGMHAAQHFDIYAEPAAILAQPWSYMYNRRVIEAAGLNIYSALFPNSLHYDVPGEDQWRTVLEAEQAVAENWITDSTVFDKLQHIADRCAAEGARLLFVEYPTHPDLQRIMHDAGLSPAREAYLARLRTMAPVLDLDQPGLFPTDRAFWRDPLHLSIDAQRELITRIWGKP